MTYTILTLTSISFLSFNMQKILHILSKYQSAWQIVIQNKWHNIICVESATKS